MKEEDTDSRKQRLQQSVDKGNFQGADEKKPSHNWTADPVSSQSQSEPGQRGLYLFLSEYMYIFMVI